jgi:hypothetical protein
VPFSADGSGSLAAIAEMEDNFKPKMTVGLFQFKIQIMNLFLGGRMPQNGD